MNGRWPGVGECDQGVEQFGLRTLTPGAFLTLLQEDSVVSQRFSEESEWNGLEISV